MHGQLSKVSVGAHALAVRRAGDGPPLLLLHDGGSTAERDFGAFADALAERFTVLAPDLRGHGLSDPVDRVFWPGLVRDVTRVLADAEVAPAHVLGVGDGGTLALHLALEEPQRVASLVLAGARSQVTDEDVERMDALRPENLRVAAPALSQSMSALHGPSWEHLMDRWVASFRLDRSYLDARARLHHVTQPALVLHGTRDPLASPAHADALGRGLPHARVVLVASGRRVQDCAEFPSLVSGFWDAHAWGEATRGGAAARREAAPAPDTAPVGVKRTSVQTSLSTL